MRAVKNPSHKIPACRPSGRPQSSPDLIASIHPRVGVILAIGINPSMNSASRGDLRHCLPRCKHRHPTQKNIIPRQRTTTGTCTSAYPGHTARRQNIAKHDHVRVQSAPSAIPHPLRPLSLKPFRARKIESAQTATLHCRVRFFKIRPEAKLINHADRATARATVAARRNSRDFCCKYMLIRLENPRRAHISSSVRIGVVQRIIWHVVPERHQRLGHVLSSCMLPQSSPPRRP